MTLGLPHAHHRVCDSTNDLAKKLAEAGAPHGATVTTNEQTAGHGRQGRSWVAPAGDALLMSVIVRPVLPRHSLASLAAGLAVAETCEQLRNLSARIKWPNDVWIEGRKVAGILVEARPEAQAEHSWMVVGIGLNTSVDMRHMPADLQETAGSLALPRGTDALTPLLDRLTRWFAAEEPEVVDAWRERDALRGSRISWSSGAGTATGIDNHGNLVVALDDGTTETLAAGEVHLSLD
ncbi:MAG: biotin--[acetyl-CoA-carboxylase] ligase [Actinobacteria bacterium]|nr:biotin--[acetyl-CoA-carboxylase] ligase [Actinomycetota bacterium]